MRLVYKRLMRTICQHLILIAREFDASRYLTYIELFYGFNLLSFDKAHFETAMQLTIKSNILRWKTSIITAEFRLIRGSEMQASFSEKTGFERLAR